LTFAFVDLFAGCGGLSLGLMQAGATGLFAVEKMADAFLTHEHNLGGRIPSRQMAWPSSIPRTAHDINVLIDEHAPAIKRVGRHVDVLVGGPPCQGFSVYGRRRPNDGRNRLYQKYLEFVELTQPEAVVLENVAGIDMPFVSAREGTGTSCRRTAAWRIQDRLAKLGYSTQCLRLCASDFGVPQNRTRFFVIGLRTTNASLVATVFADGLREELRQDHLASLGLRPAQKVTCKQALSDLETHGRRLVPCDDFAGFEQVQYRGPRTQYQRLMHGELDALAAPNSTRLARHRPATVEKFELIHAQGLRGYRAGVRAQALLASAKHRVNLLDPLAPAPTITTLPDDFVHYSEPRILTVRECARLQSFPDWFEFKGKYTSGGDRRIHECPRFTQVGNAVPPLLAQFMGAYVGEILRIARQPMSLRKAA
jgi:DNA (cytosine-5)-methyltransferase 1